MVEVKRVELPIDNRAELKLNVPKILEFSVEKGDRIRGLVDLISGENLDVFLVDSASYADWRNGEQFEYLDGDEAVRAITLDARAEDKDHWFLILLTGAWLGPSTVYARVRLTKERP